LEPLCIAFANVLHAALEAAVLLQQLLADLTHLRHDRIFLFINDWPSGYGHAPSGLAQRKSRECAGLSSATPQFSGWSVAADC
jgi:hypothetical protein